MHKTQIQVPDELFAELQAFAQRREWSLAETFRRGAELLLETYPRERPPVSESWEPPSSSRVGWKGRTPEELRDLAFADQHREAVER